jgi:hypothetical protein
MHPRILYLTILSCATFGMAMAQAPTPQAPSSGQGAPHGGQHHGPPPEALAACAGKAAGAACGFTGRRNEALTGTCFAPQRREGNGAAQGALPLACRPNHGTQPQGGPGKPGQSSPGQR